MAGKSKDSICKGQDNIPVSIRQIMYSHSSQQQREDNICLCINEKLNLFIPVSNKDKIISVSVSMRQINCFHSSQQQRQDNICLCISETNYVFSFQSATKTR
jgi:hypothetical protein